MADDASTQPPPPGPEKAQAPATFSSFINKSGSGKKFAPKAARRRPGAAPGAPAAAPKAPAPAPATTPVTTPAPVTVTTPAPSTAEPQTAQAASEPSNTAEPTAPAPVPLPTPAPTQEPAAHTAAPAPTEPAVLAPSPTPAPTPAIEQPQHTQNAPPPPPTNQVEAAQPVDDHVDAQRSPKRRRIESPSRQSTPMMPVAVMLPSQGAQTSDATPQQSAPDVEGGATSTAGPGETSLTPPVEGEATQPNGRRRNLPWTAVNHSQEEGGEASEGLEPAARKRAPAKPRAKKKPTLSEEGDQQENGGEEEAEPTQTRASARARGKRKADAADGSEGSQPVEPPPKKPRKPRKDKGKQPAVEGEPEQGDTAAEPKKKPRAPRRKKASPAEGEDGSVEPKPRGRPPREDTPSDAEDHTIDPDAVCMDDLASRNIRVGKLSRREREMRKIDWEAVKQRRREEDARHISTKESQAAVDKLLEMGQVEQVPTGPRYHVVDGRIELIQDSGTIDRERDADREIELMTITEEDDLTTRITARSFMKNNKRFPNEFVLPGQGRRWNAESTDMFYQGLRSFGTDFQMIAHMFPGMTRRSIKTKFTREERENPDIVRQCLRGKSELASHWDHFLAASQLEEESFADADQIKRDLEEEEARMREQINEALREKEEREKQKKLAGLTEEGDGEKENAKGKKKRRQKDKNVTFQEEGVEILGEVDDDPNWGVE